MRIEILVGLENPVFYPINKSKTIIGSDLSCDIVVSEDQISRKHLIILKEDENYFVIDQGSTNGSYLNEERLIPGRRVEFTSYFPIRLGSSVLVSLVSDEEALDEVNKISIPFPGESSQPKKDPRPETPKRERDPEEKTTVISLRDLQKSSTGSMVKRREAYKKKVAARAKEEADPKKKKKGKKKKKKKFLEFYEIVALMILAGALYFTYVGDDEDKVAMVAVQDKPLETQDTEAAPVAKVLPKSPKLLELFDLKEVEKCQSIEEKLLCNSVRLSDKPWAGTTTRSGQLITLVDGDPFVSEAKSLYSFPPEEKTSDSSAVEKYEADILEIAVGLFIANGFVNDDFKKIKEKELVFALMTSRDGIYLVSVSFAITPEDLNFVRSVMTTSRVNQFRQSGAKVMFFRKDFYDLVI